jgi:PAS domain S-box-containing protein
MTTRRIMIVEDETMVAAQMARSLECLGYEVATIEVSGEDAVRRADALKPDLILMDIKLDGKMDGIEAARLIVSRFPVPIIYTSAYSRDPILERAKETHPVGYLVKPIPLEALRVNIELAFVKHEIEQQIAQSERRYRALIETQTELVCRYLPDGTFTFVNQAYCDFFGLKPEDLIGRRFAPVVLGGDRAREQEHLALFCPEDSVHSHEIEVLAQDGGERFLEWTDKAIFDAQGTLTEFQGVGRDITEQRKAEEALRRSEALFRSTFNQAAVGMAHVDQNGRWLRVTIRRCATSWGTRRMSLSK